MLSATAASIRTGSRAGGGPRTQCCDNGSADTDRPAKQDLSTGVQAKRQSRCTDKQSNQQGARDSPARMTRDSSNAACQETAVHHRRGCRVPTGTAYTRKRQQVTACQKDQLERQGDEECPAHGNRPGNCAASPSGDRERKSHTDGQRQENGLVGKVRQVIGVKHVVALAYPAPTPHRADAATNTAWAKMPNWKSDASDARRERGSRVVARPNQLRHVVRERTCLALSTAWDQDGKDTGCAYV